ncbi:MAG: globin domain-containing protein [Gammaproteobacteria bacterium]|nr:globin domain-containing protein [Gammaproteobacteria bacterium]
MGRGNSLGIDARTIRDSFALLADRADELVDRFYEKLLAKQDVAALFVNTDMDEQKNKLAGAIGFVVKNLDNTEVLVAELNNMGVRHKHYGAEARHYGVVTDTLISVMANMAGKNWTSNIESAWRDLLNVASTVMLSAGAGATVGGVNRIGVKEAKQ